MADVEFKMCTDPEHEGPPHLPVTDFYKRRGGRQPFCKKCMSRRNLRAYHNTQRRKGIASVSKVDPTDEARIAANRIAVERHPRYMTTGELLEGYGVVGTDGVRRIGSDTVQLLLSIRPT